jgi:uncharacterized protein YqgC (DUF456 family)
MTIALWILAIALIVVGVAGTVLPALPGPILVFAGVALAAWIDDFVRISGWTVGVLGVLTLIAWGVDYVAGALGAKKAGASGRDRGCRDRDHRGDLHRPLGPRLHAARRRGDR